MANTTSAVALFKGYTAVDEPLKFYLPIFKFNEGATVPGCVALAVRGRVLARKVESLVVGRAYLIDYVRESREVVRVVGEVDSSGALVQ